jgi:hypothetical protein
MPDALSRYGETSTAYLRMMAKSPLGLHRVRPTGSL